MESTVASAHNLGRYTLSYVKGLGAVNVALDNKYVIEKLLLLLHQVVLLLEKLLKGIKDYIFPTHGRQSVNLCRPIDCRLSISYVLESAEDILLQSICRNSDAGMNPAPTHAAEQGIEQPATSIGATCLPFTGTLLPVVGSCTYTAPSTEASIASEKTLVQGLGIESRAGNLGQEGLAGASAIGAPRFERGIGVGQQGLAAGLNRGGGTLGASTGAAIPMTARQGTDLLRCEGRTGTSLPGISSGNASVGGINYPSAPSAAPSVPSAVRSVVSTAIDTRAALTVPTDSPTGLHTTQHSSSARPSTRTVPVEVRYNYDAIPCLLKFTSYPRCMAHSVLASRIGR